jgi:integrase/recombinase XerD
MLKKAMFPINTCVKKSFKMNWNQALKEYENYLSLERALSSHSLEAYKHDVVMLQQFVALKGYDVNPAEVKPFVIEQLLIWLSELGLAAASQARILSGLKGFYKFLFIESYILEDPTHLLVGPKMNRHLPDTLDLEEIELILKQIDLSNLLGGRNRAIIELLYASGMRVSELTNLRISCLFLEIGYVRVIGKGDKERLIPVSEDAIRFLQLYLAHIRPHLPIKKGFEDIVFLNRRGAGLSRVMIFLIVKELAAMAGIEKSVSPHTFRHSFATHLLEGGADLMVVKDLLGHESITTTELYTHLDIEHLRKAILRFHPRNQNQRVLGANE